MKQCAEIPRSLHSRYKPQAEAERYIDSLPLKEKARFFILIEPGLGYLAAPLKRKFPGAKIVALHAGRQAGEQPEPGPDSQWYPDTGISVQDFLEKEIPDSESSFVEILEWRPALAVYGGAYLAIMKEAVEFVKRSDANARTISAFGRSWFRNFFRNLLIMRELFCPVPISMPLLVTGAGPGLEDAIPLIREERGRFFILAASSSAMALEAGGLFPDMLISTDGGAWARYHLYGCFRVTRHPMKGACSLAMAMNAALPSQCETMPLLPISDGSLWQTLILKELGIPFIILPQRGTVSAAALDLAFSLAKGDVFIAGMDLANHDICSHARPYSLDRFLEEDAGRLKPAYSLAYRRSSALKAGGSFEIYASWFRKQLSNYPKAIHTLGKNNPLFDAPETADPFTVAAKTTGEPGPQGRPHVKTLTLHPTGNPCKKAAAVLEKALENSSHSAALRDELNSLLFPGDAVPSTGELVKAIRSLCRAGELSP